MSMKSHRYGTGFLTEVTGGGRGVHAVGQDIQADLKRIENIDLFGAYKVDPKFSRHNDLYRLIIHALHALKMEPEMYVSGRPSTAGPKIFAIKSPQSLRSLAQDVGAAIKAGHPPTGFWLGLTGPDSSQLENFINEAHVIWRTGWRKLRDNAGSIKDPKAARAKFIDQAEKLIVELAKKRLTKKPILAWIELRLATKQGVAQKRGQGGETRTLFQFERVGHDVGGYSGGYFTKKPTQQQRQHLMMTNEYANEHLMDIRTSMMDIIFHDAWSAFDYWVQKAPDGFVRSMEEVLENEAVRKQYDTSQGYEVKKDLQPKPQTFKREKGSLVVGSVRGTGSTIGSMIVTAKEAERDRQDAQGQWIRRPKLPRQLGDWVPAEHVKGWLSGDKYSAIFGLYYNHPLVVPVKNRQVYWYSNKNMFHKAVYQYAAMTGEPPTLVYRIFRKTGDRAGLNITRPELDKDYSADGRRFRQGLDAVIQSFNRLAKDGVAIQGAEVAKYLGPDVTIRQDDWADMPNVPKGVDPQGFKRYVNWVRKETTTTLGLNFMRNMPTSLVDPSTGRVKRLPHHRHQISAISALHAESKFGAEKDARGRAVEESGIYLVEYLLGHKRDMSMAETYMIPLNVIRADENYAPLHKSTSMNKSTLMGLLTKSFPGLRVIRDPGAWIYIPASKRQNLPYARLIRPSTVLGHELPDVNRRLPKRYKRTQHGYMIDGKHWYAYQMLVVMPPSKAEKQLGLIRRNAYRRLVIDDPGMVDRLRRGVRGQRVNLKDFGATPHEVGTIFPGDREGVEAKTYREQPFDKASLSGVDIPGIVGKESKLDLHWLLGDRKDRWEPKFEEIAHEIYKFVQRKITEYTSANTVEKKVEVLKEYKAEMQKYENKVEFDISTYLQALEANSRSKAGKVDIDTAKAAQTYIRYSKQLISGTSHHIVVPTVIKDLPLSVYEAHFGAIGHKPLEYSVKAVSESVARYLVLLRLLRRSVSNREMGKAMDIRSRMGRKIFPDINARTLAMWAKTGFLVIEQNEPRGSFRVGSRKQLDRDELRRGEKYSQHRYAYWLRTD